MSKEKYTYEFDNSTGVMFKYYFGLITLEDIITSWEYAFANNLIPKSTKGFVVDYRQANFNMKIDEHKHIADFYKNHPEIFGKLKTAVVTDDPHDVIIPTLVEMLNEGYYSRTFSTLEAAIEWVLR